MRQYALIVYREEDTLIEPCVAQNRAEARGLALELARREKERGGGFVVIEVRCLRSPKDDADALPMLVPGQMAFNALDVS